MQRRTLLFVSTLALALFGDVRSVPLHKRFAGDGTFYDAGLGACGDQNTNADLICAMNAPQYDGSCNRVVNIKGPKGSVQCTIKDKCPVCAFGSIDMTPAAFNQIADPSQGRVSITWDFVDGPSPGGPEPQPEPSPSPPPPPPQPSPSKPPPSDDQDPPKNSQEDSKQDPDDGKNDDKATDTGEAVHSVSYVFITGDSSLIDGGELVNGGNPLDDPDEYYNQIVNNVTDSDPSDGDQQTTTKEDPSPTPSPTASATPGATQYY